MSLTFGPRKVGIGVTSPSQVKVETLDGQPAALDGSISVGPNSTITFTVQEAGRYYITARTAYFSETVTEDLLEDSPYDSTNLRSIIDYLLSSGSGTGGAVSSVCGKVGAVTLNASDVNAKPSSYIPSWSELTGKPSTFTPATHTHDISAVTGLQPALDAKLNIADAPSEPPVTSVAGKIGDVTLTASDAHARADTWTPAWSDVRNKPTFSTVASTGNYDDLSNRPSIPDTPDEVGAAALVHSHVIANVTGLQTELDSKAASIHTHTISQVTNLTNTLAGKSDTGHTHTMSNVTGLTSELDGLSDSIGMASSRIDEIDSELTALDTSLAAVARTGNYNDLTGKPSNLVTSSTVTAIWQGTQAEYDAIGTKSNTTFYIIKA